MRELSYPLPSASEPKVIYLAVPATLKKVIGKEGAKELEDEETSDKIPEKASTTESPEEETSLPTNKRTTKKTKPKSKKAENVEAESADERKTNKPSRLETPTPEETSAVPKQRGTLIVKGNLVLNLTITDIEYYDDYEGETSPQPSLVVADVSTKAKKLIPTEYLQKVPSEVLEKRFNSLRKLKVSSSEGYQINTIF